MEQNILGTTTCNNDKKNRAIVILTLQRHQDGIWIRRLVNALRDELLLAASSKKKKKKGDDLNGNDNVPIIQVQALEEWLSQGWIVTSDTRDGIENGSTVTSIFENVIGIVNRVSDAAPPMLFKACIAILSAAQLLQIPLFNGPTSYALSANKWCQHVLFAKAKLLSPPTMAYWNTLERPANLEKYQNEFFFSSKNDTTSSNASSGTSSSTNFLLIKPNAGGFGNGIARVSSNYFLAMDDADDDDDNNSSNNYKLPLFDDGISLIQKYISPKHQKLYRVWFLCGKIQCAVERTIYQQVNDNHNNDNDPKTMAEFTGACAAGSGGACSNEKSENDLRTMSEFSGACGGACSLSSSKTQQQKGETPQSSKFQAWQVPDIVQDEIETQLLPILPNDAHCGSVEFLYPDDKNTEQRMYFDLNLLSTLPITNVCNDPNHIWPNDYDPWRELAQSILKTLVVF